ncbi:MAG: hypothetical protein KBG10_08690 [Anaerolineaceae bacterium]|nr:hypothetical protein [Anaerolineaceae bacterium]
MSKNTDTTKMKIERCDPKTNLVILGTTFMATLDKKKYFPKHISLYCQVEEPSLFAQISGIPIGTEIMAKVTSDLQHGKNYLEGFTLVD